MTFHPLGDGNCQFSATAHQLNVLGIRRSASKLREEIVKYLEENQSDQQDMPLEMFVDIPFSQYLQEVATDGTYGDELTLSEVSNICQVDITLVLSLGSEGQLEINPTEFQSFGRIVLGHFAEGYGEHYVGLDQEWQENQNGSSTSSHNVVETNVHFNLSKSTFFFNWDSLHARPKSHCKAWSYKKKKYKKIKTYKKSA